MLLRKLVFSGKRITLSGSTQTSTRYRLRGHRDQVTAIRFLTTSDDMPSTSTASASGLLLTVSKDTFMKLWDLSTQHCIQTVVAHRSEVWTMDINAEQDLIFTGSGEGELKAWRIDRAALAEGLKETETGEVRPYLERSLGIENGFQFDLCRLLK